MKAILKLATGAIVLVGMSGATCAYACRVPKAPFDPALERSDVIILGRVTATRQDAPLRGKWFRIRIQSVVAGRFHDETYQTGSATGPGACEPRGPDVAQGDLVAVHFRYRNGKRVEQGWIRMPADSPPRR